LLHDFLFLNGMPFLVPSLLELLVVVALVLEHGDQIGNRRILPPSERRGILPPDGAVGTLVCLELDSQMILAMGPST